MAFTPKKLLSGLILLTSLASLMGCSSPPASQLPEPAASSSEETSAVSQVPFSYDLYAEILETYVDDQGFVDYEGLQQNREPLDQFNTSIGAVSPDTYNGWGDAEKMAFLINAYNSFTLQSIIDQTPIKESIRDIPGVWRVRQFRIAGESKTLDDIEHQTLRKDFNDPRIHAALNCTALSCPVLRREPYTADQLDQQLDEQVNLWLSSPHGLEIDRTANEVKISEIFNWFGEDWLKAYGTVEGFTGSNQDKAILYFISQYTNAGDRAYLQQGDYQLKYLEYDWALNQQNQN